MIANPFFRNCLDNETDLFGQIARFAGDVVSFVHPSRVETLLPLPVFRRLASKPKTRRVLGNFLAQQFRLEPFSIELLSNPLHQLVLLDWPVLMRLMVCAGVCCYTDDLKQLIEKKKVVAFRKALGDDVYRFALQQAPFLFPHCPVLPPLPPQSSLVDKVQLRGRQCLSWFVAGEPWPLQQRFQLKFPIQESFDFSVSIEPDQHTTLGKFLRRILEKVLRREDSSCFI